MSTVMLVTLLFRHFVQHHRVDDFFSRDGDFLDVNRSPISQSCRQHKRSQTSVNNFYESVNTA